MAASAAFFWQTPGSMFPWLLAIFLSLSSFTTATKWRIMLAHGALFSLTVVALTYVESAMNPPAVVADRRMSRTNSIERVNSRVFSRANMMKLVGTGGYA